MTVRELIDELNRFEDDIEVVMKPCNSDYVHNICEAERRNVRGFWNDKTENVVLFAYDQTGAI